MTVIAYATLSPSEALYKAAARTTPVVEPLPQGVLMDWTGGGAVPSLALELQQALQDAAGEMDALAAANYLYVAPLRFAALALARGTTKPLAAPIPGGFWLSGDDLPAFLKTAPISSLPDLDAQTKETLTALAAPTLGALQHIPLAVLRRHIGAAAPMLLAWSRGQDPRGVAPAYPPQRFRRSIDAEAVLKAMAAGTDALGALAKKAATILAPQWRQAGGAVQRVAVFYGKERRQRTFTQPVTDEARVARALQQLTQQLLVDVRDLKARDDLVLETVPTATPYDKTAGQKTLWNASGQVNTGPASKRQERLQIVWEGLQRRFGPIIGFSPRREAVVRYETMMRLHDVGR